jgi:hypothetical protein
VSEIRFQFVFSGKNDELTPDFPPGRRIGTAVAVRDHLLALPPLGH